MTRNTVDKAVEILNSHGVVGMPTETVYGLAARIDSLQGLNLIFRTKQRPFFDPLIVHVCSIEQAQSLVLQWPPVAQILAERFWPGPLTMVLTKNTQVNDLITSGLMTVGIRMPKHPLALELIEKTGVPLAAPSANRFGHTSPTSAAHVQSEFATPLFVVDGGVCEAGIESTIVGIEIEKDFCHLAILRLGVISQSEIESCLQENGISHKWKQKVDRIQAPGQMKHHYMPSVPLVIYQNGMGKNQILKEVNARLSHLPDEVEGIKMVKPDRVEHFEILQLSKEPGEAARMLYSELRRLGEKPGVQMLAFEWDKEIFGSYLQPVESWAPVMDRLIKAASLRL